MDKIRAISVDIESQQNNSLSNAARQPHAYAQAITRTIIAASLTAASLTGVSALAISRGIRKRHLTIQRSLQTEVTKRTEELHIANNQLLVTNEQLKLQLLVTNEQLKLHDKMQNEFKSLVDDVQPKLVADTSNNKVKVVYRSLKDREGGVDNHSDNVFVQADRDRITQVISNLLDNALKFTRQGLVSVAVSITKEHNQRQEGENEKEVVVSVGDSGSGIDPEIYPAICKIKSFSGTGPGLYISKSIIEAHDGKIWAKNNNERENVVLHFCFSLPLVVTYANA
jgi:signal transduction histidine kinase